MTTALTIAHHTFREATRDRVLAAALGAGLALLVVAQLVSPLALGEGLRLSIDLTLSGISIIGLLLVLLVGPGQVSREIERRTIFHVLSRPVARHQVLVGKWAGLAATLWVVAIAIGVALMLVLVVEGHVAHVPAIAEAIVFAGLELTILTAVAILFSALSTPVLSALFTLALFVLGQWSYDLRAFATHFPPALASLCRIAANLVPNLPLFNVRTLATEAQLATPVHLLLAVAYAAAYCVGALGLATLALEARDFK